MICYPQFPRERDMPHHAGSHGETPGDRRRKLGQKPLLLFSQEGMGEEGYRAEQV